MPRASLAHPAVISVPIINRNVSRRRKRRHRSAQAGREARGQKESGGESDGKIVSDKCNRSGRRCRSCRSSIKLHKCLPSDLQMCHFLSQQWLKETAARQQRETEREGERETGLETTVNMARMAAGPARMRIAVVIGNGLIDF